ncbi:hypothetical protein POUND7_015379 [Theobroma cacao]
MYCHNYNHHHVLPCLHCHPHSYIRMCGGSYRKRIGTFFKHIFMPSLPGLSWVGISKGNRDLKGKSSSGGE